MAVQIARSSDLAAVGANGGAWTVDMGVAPPGMPGNLSVAPTGAWVPAGALSDDGIARAFAEKSQEIYALGQISPYITLVTQSTATFTQEFYETRRAIVKSVMYRKQMLEVQADASGKYAFAESPSGVIDKRSWLFAVLNGPAFEWYYLPIATVALTKDQTFSGDKIASIETEITPYPDAQGNTIYHVGQLKPGVTDQ